MKMPNSRNGTRFDVKRRKQPHFKAQGAGLQPQAQRVIVTAIINLDKLEEVYQQVLQRFSSMLPPPRFIQIVLPFKMALIHCSQAPEHREVQTTGNISRPAASVEWVFFLTRTDALPGYCHLPVKLKYKRPQFHSLHSKTTLPDARKQRSCYSSQVPPSLSPSVSSPIRTHRAPIKESSHYTFQTPTETS